MAWAGHRPPGQTSTEEVPAKPRTGGDERAVFLRRRLCVTVNTTAILHATGTAFVGVGVLLLDGSLSIGFLVLGALLFVAGIVAARRDDSGPPDVT